MKKILFMAVLGLAICMGFASCEKENEGDNECYIQECTVENVTESTATFKFTAYIPENFICLAGIRVSDEDPQNTIYISSSAWADNTLQGKHEYTLTVTNLWSGHEYKARPLLMTMTDIVCWGNLVEFTTTEQSKPQ